MVIDKVKKTINERSLIEKGEHIVIGVSGGPDSVCLLHVFTRLSAEWDLKLHAVHINHNLRGRDADQDQLYVQSLCEALGVPCKVFSYNVKAMAKASGMTTEEMGRKVRYDSFQSVSDQIASPKVKIAVAQNKNDQVETLLMRILRGTGTDGLASIEYKREERIIRPLLDITREEIESYCRIHNLYPRTDLSNLEPVYTRNKIRLNLLPYLKKEFNESIIEALNRLVNIASEDKDFLYQHVNAAKLDLELNENLTSYPRDKYEKLHPAVGKRLINQVFKDMGLLQDISAYHLDEGDRLIRTGNTGDRLDFPRGYFLRISYNIAEFCKPVTEEADQFDYPIKGFGLTDLPDLNAVLRVSLLERREMELSSVGNPNMAQLDCEDILQEGKLRIRSRKPGDYIIPFGMTGSKKIQDYFVDQKIKKESRDSIPLVCYGSEVIWIVGHRINEKYKVKKDTTEIVLLEYITPV